MPGGVSGGRDVGPVPVLVPVTGNPGPPLDADLNPEIKPVPALVGELYPPADDVFWDDWDAACVFFRHDFRPEDSPGIRPAGFLGLLSPQQMVNIYRTLRRISKDGMDYSLGANGMLFEMGIMALCWSVFDRCGEEDHVTSPSGGEDAARLEKEIGIQCACRPKSLTMQVCQQTVRGPHVILACNDEEVAILLEQVKLCFGVDRDQSRPWMIAACYKDDKLRLGHPGLGRGSGSDVKITAHDLMTRFTTRRTLLSDIADEMPMREIRQKCKAQPSLVNSAIVLGGSGPPMYARERVILILSCRDIDLRRFERLFSTTHTILGQGRGERREVKVVGSLTASSLAWQLDSIYEDMQKNMILDLIDNVCHVAEKGPRRSRYIKFFGAEMKQVDRF